MAILRVAQMGHPVLRLVAQPVDPDTIMTDEVQRFLDDLLETMEEYDGAGLAAPQVHVSLRVVVLTLDPEVGPEFLINPKITPLNDDTTRTVEGCLSVHRLRGVVERPAHIRLEFLDRFGRECIYELHGFPAVVVQHECDHLDGVLYVDRVDPVTLSFLDEYERFGPLDRLVDGYQPPPEIDDEIVIVQAPDDDTDDDVPLDEQDEASPDDAADAAPGEG